MNPKLMSVIKYSFGILLGVLLLWLAFRNIELEAAINQIQKANFLWVAFSLSIALFSHFVRAVRWRMLLQPVGYLPNTYNTFAAVVIGYMANNAVPRLGEISRCSLLTRSDKIPFTVAIGTVVLERLMDMLIMMVFLGIAFFLEYEKILLIIDQMTQGQSSAQLENRWIFFGVILILCLIMVGLIIKFYAQLLQIPLFRKIVDFLIPLFKSFTSITRVKYPWLFCFLTLLIWFCYIAQFYIAFKALEETQHLSFYFGFMMMIIGSLGVIVPVPGGVGAFHYLTLVGFMAFGYSETAAISYALLVHAANYLIILLAGIICYITLIIKPSRDAAIKPINL
jgi:uncharacterized protein (TIRG00374 family)